MADYFLFSQRRSATTWDNKKFLIAIHLFQYLCDCVNPSRQGNYEAIANSPNRL